MTIRHAIHLAVGLAMLSPAVARAQSPGAPSLTITAHNISAAARRTSGASRDSMLARPGDSLRYTLVFTNHASGAVNNVQFVDPLPSGLVYMLGTARADRPVRIEYSIDGGKSYVAQPTVSVMENGARVQKPAPREAYTHIRWTVIGTLAPAGHVTAEFEAQVRTQSGS